MVLDLPFATKTRPAAPRPLILLAIAILIAPSPGRAQTPAKFDPAVEAQVFSELNQSRAQAKLPPLKLDPKLTEAARQHTLLLLKHHELSHQFPGEPELSSRLHAAGVIFTQGGENSGMNSDADNLNEAFLESPGHRANMLSPTFTAVGIGVLESDSGYWITEDFATETAELSVDAVENQVAAAFDKKWMTVAPTPLKRVVVPELHAMACEIAAKGALEKRLLKHDGYEVRQFNAYTTATPSVLPADVDSALALTGLHEYAVAACSPQESGNNGAYWILIVFF